MEPSHGNPIGWSEDTIGDGLCSGSIKMAIPGLEWLEFFFIIVLV